MSTNYHFGIAGWSYPDWNGIVYPEGKKLDELSYLADYFDVIELNNSFYRIPSVRMTENWAKRVSHNAHFQFTAKLWQGFTHEKKPIQQEEVDQFKEAMHPLLEKGRLGALLAQFPFSFKNEATSQDRLHQIVEKFRKFPLVLEFRNRSWINPDVVQWMEKQKVGFCNVDEPVFRQMIRPSATVTGPIAYVRFHGRNYKNWFARDANRDSRYDYFYTEEELESWVPRIRQMGERAGDVYVIGNNHFRGHAPANILQLKSKIEQEPVNIPETLLHSYPQLRKISEK